MSNNIVYLYSEIMPYQTIVYKQLSDLGYNVHAFYVDKKRLTPYKPTEIKNVWYYPKSEYTQEQMLKKVMELSPKVLVVCGWAYSDYLYVAKKVKKTLQIPVVCPIDTQYIHRLKQRIGLLFAPFYFKRFFTHIWVPGVRQYDFARRMGYDSNSIILNSLTGNIDLFNKADIEKKKKAYPKKILFVGRYHEVKGLELLLKVWNSIECKNGWSLVCAGNGPLKHLLENSKDIEVLDFQPQESLVKLAEECGLFILPSKYEPWALVLQEFAAAGLPILCSDACGAASHLVINGYNGYTFETNDEQSLKAKLLKIMNLDDDKMLYMANNSRKLAQFVTPEISAKSLLSVINK